VPSSPLIYCLLKLCGSDDSALCTQFWILYSERTDKRLALPLKRKSTCRDRIEPEVWFGAFRMEMLGKPDRVAAVVDARFEYAQAPWLELGERGLDFVYQRVFPKKVALDKKSLSKDVASMRTMVQSEVPR
jgi:hypothetical protein